MLALTLIQVAEPVRLPTKIMERIIKLWLPVVFFMGWIFYTSSIPGTDIPPLFPYQEVFYHILMFSILAYFFARASKITFHLAGPMKIILLTLIFGILYAISDEFHQSFVPNRTSSGFDVFMDGVGTFLGGLICRFQM